MLSRFRRANSRTLGKDSNSPASGGVRRYNSSPSNNNNNNGSSSHNNNNDDPADAAAECLHELRNKLDRLDELTEIIRLEQQQKLLETGSSNNSGVSATANKMGEKSTNNASNNNDSSASENDNSSTNVNTEMQNQSADTPPSQSTSVSPLSSSNSGGNTPKQPTTATANDPLERIKYHTCTSFKHRNLTCSLHCLSCLLFVCEFPIFLHSRARRSHT